MGTLDLPNRIAMAPLTRMRARPADHVPTGVAGGLLRPARFGRIDRCRSEPPISPEGFGWADTPGLWSRDQIRGWRQVTDAVHAAGGAHHRPALAHRRDIAPPISAAAPLPAFGFQHRSGTAIGNASRAACPTAWRPRAMTRDEIRQTIADYARAARNAMQAGFDGVQILANFLYLIAQFLNKATNRPHRRVWRRYRSARARILFRNRRSRAG